MANLCENCKHLSTTLGQEKPYFWYCLKHPREEENYLSKDYRIYPPYRYCRDINKGNCKDFERKEDVT